MEQFCRFGRVIRDRPADDRHRTRPRPTLPSALQKGLGAGHQPQPGFDPADDDQRGSGAAGEPEAFDPTAGQRQDLDPWRLRHRRIVAC